MSIFGIPQYEKAFSNIQKNNQFLEDDYFMKNKIKTLNQQRNKFDEALKAPKKKTPAKVNNPPLEPVEPKPPTPNKKKDKSNLVSVKMLNDLLDKRNSYLKTIFREEEDIYQIQSKYIEYEHQIRKTMNRMEDLFAYQIQPSQEQEHENAVQQIYYNLEIWETIQNYNKNKGLTEFQGLESIPIGQVREDMQRIIQEKMPDDLKHLTNPGQMAEPDEEEIPNSFLKDKSFMRKREIIQGLRTQKKVISKTEPKEEEVENVPQINVRPSPEEEEPKNLEKSQEMHKIGEDDAGEQVSQINVEEDSEIEYHMDNINGRSLKLN